MRTLLKWAAVLLLTVIYALAAWVLALLPAGKLLRRSFLIRNTSFFSRIFLALLGVRVHRKHCGRLKTAAPGCLIVANHVSYLDVLVVSSLVPSVFITSVELGNTALLGMLARLGGSLFVDRRKATGLKRELSEITRVLGSGPPVVLFPEGTTSNGDRVTPFKNALFDAARLSRSAVLPLCLRYRKINNQPVCLQNRNAIYFYGGAAFLPHLSQLLKVGSIDVEVVCLQTIPVHEPITRKELAAAAHHAIASAYHAALPDRYARGYRHQDGKQP